MSVFQVTYQRTFKEDDRIYLYNDGVVEFVNEYGAAVYYIDVDNIDHLIQILTDVKRARQEDIAEGSGF